MKTRNSIKICWLTDCYVNKETKDNISAGSSSAGGESQSVAVVSASVPVPVVDVM